MSDPPNGTARRDDRSGVTDGGPDLDALAARLSAVERAVTDDETELSASSPSDSAGRCDDLNLDGRLSTVEESLADLDGRLGEVEAATQALRGYVGAVRSVNREVERRADAALAAVERLEAEGGGEKGRDALREVDQGYTTPADCEGEIDPVVDGGRDGQWDDGGGGNSWNDREDADEAGDGAGEDDVERWGVAERLRDVL